MFASRGLVLSLAVLGLAASAHAQSVAGGRFESAMGAFGASLAIVDNEVVVGEPNNRMRPGTVYFYRKSGSNWREASKLTASDGQPGDFFGAAMSVDGQTMLVSATRQNENKGAVYVFQRSGNAWRESGKLIAADGAANDGFGGRVLVRGDWAFVSAQGQTQATGAVYVFRRSGGNWTQTAKLTSSEAKPSQLFGASLAFASDALIVGEPGFNTRTGIVRVFRADAAGEWKETAKLSPTGIQPSHAFGTSVAAQGDAILVGAPGNQTIDGLVVHFRVDASGAIQEQRRLLAFEAARQELFGAALAMDGARAWVGSPFGGARRGAVYSYWRGASDSLWTGVERIISASAERGDAFGANIATRGNLAAVTMSSDDFGSGTVVVFERINDAWREQTVLKSAGEFLTSITGKKTECSDGKAASFECRDYDLMSFLSVGDVGGTRGEVLSGSWGWTDPETGKEYAIIGRAGGTSFVDVSNPEKPVFLGDLPKTKEANTAVWREIKTYKNWALIVSDGAGPHGVQFFDLTRLRNVKNAPVKFEPDHTYNRVASVHDIVVNEDAGMAFATGSNGGGETCGGGLHMIDVKDPKNPQFVGCFADPQTGRASTGYSHDALCVTYKGPDKDYQGREICLGSNETMLSVADVTDKKAPKAISRASYPKVGYAHQGWYDAEQRYFYMNDELDETGRLTPRTRTLIWDLADLDDPQMVGEFLGTTAASDHNLYIVGNLMYQSNYVAGLRIIDISDRRNPVEVGFFDTAAGENNPGFSGSWNNYPFFKSGNIVISSMGEGIFVVRKKAPKVVS